MRRAFRTGPESTGLRADVYLASLCPDLTRSRIAALMREGAVWLESRPARPGDRLKPGQLLEVDVPPPVLPSVEPEPMDLHIVYEDADMLVLDKARGVVVHPAAGNPSGTLVNGLLAHCSDLSGIGGELRPGIVHRLDKDTTGLMVVAKNDRAHRSLSEQIKNKTAQRIYIALVEGHPGDGRVEAPVGRHRIDRKRMAVVSDGRPAATLYTTLYEFEHDALIRLELTTGRTHQIRVHMAHIGHPVVGDKVYGLKKQRYDLPGQMLHAASLILNHPRTGEVMAFTAPLPADFLDLLQTIAPGGDYSVDTLLAVSDGPFASRQNLPGDE